MAKILVVDDEPKTREIIRRHLMKDEHEVREADSGKAALEEIRKNLPDVILLDVILPDLSGFELCKRIRSDPKQVPIYTIMLTVLDSIEEKRTGLDIGAHDYVTKPFNAYELLARIRVGLRTIEYERNAVIDSLTGLYNKPFFNSYIVKEADKSARYQRQLSIVMIDVDYFKKVNDTHGHLTGDIVLAEIGKTLKENTRSCDLAVRWGGEEFVIILPETTLDGGIFFGERIRKLIEKKEFETVGSITISLGVAALGPDGNAMEMIRRADKALYEAKELGRNRVCAKKLSHLI